METINRSLCFKALCDDTRLAIFEQLQGKELCACQILEDLDISQPTLSFHMKKLMDCGLVMGRKDGVWMKYRVNVDIIRELSTFLLLFATDTYEQCDRGCQL